jgi:ABC-type microcin C transport system permease subunit YejB
MPALQKATPDVKTTALIVMDFMKTSCTEQARPRCVATIAPVKKLLADARAKGMTCPRVTYVHALRNALLPAVTILGLKSAEMLGGAILTETIFAWPGIGRYMFEAIRNRDFPVIQGTTLVFALIYVMTSLAVDFIHGALDPRVRRRML